MSEKTPTARLLAVEALGQVLTDGRMMSEVTTDRKWHDAEPSARAAGQRLALDTLRQISRADTVLKTFLTREPPAFVMNVLRLAAVELHSGGAAHGVVNEAVKLVGARKKTAPMKGLVNAVLRKVAAVDEAEWLAIPPSRLPSWLRKPLVGAWGAQAVDAFEDAHANGAPVDITVKSDAEAWAEKLGGTVLPTGSVRLHGAGQLSALPGYDDGDWWVQDAAAALPVRLLGDVSGQTVLDLCAAPGGKTLQLASLGADVTALDLSKARMKRVRENLYRTRLKATCTVDDALTYDKGLFDAVLLDAPCSATGTIRRHPDLPHIRNRTAVRDLMALQRDMIKAAVARLNAGGRLVFCTCSLLPEEGEVQQRWALKQEDLQLTALEPNVQGLNPAWITKDNGVRLRPDYWPEFGGMDGFFMCVVQKAG